ncbi:hypothetical protein SAMN05216371_0184 [Streptomyces sp. TLI_053]|nr:hypothetical protein SAMN05216371_0184 [Streptomyces sp. TLI_053]
MTQQAQAGVGERTASRHLRGLTAVQKRMDSAVLAQPRPVTLSWQEPDPHHPGQLLCRQALIHDTTTRPADTTRPCTRTEILDRWGTAGTHINPPDRQLTSWVQRFDLTTNDAMPRTIGSLRSMADTVGDVHGWGEWSLPVFEAACARLFRWWSWRPEQLDDAGRGEIDVQVRALDCWCRVIYDDREMEGAQDWPDVSRRNLAGPAGSRGSRRCHFSLGVRLRELRTEVGVNGLEGVQAGERQAGRHARGPAGVGTGRPESEGEPKGRLQGLESRYRTWKRLRRPAPRPTPPRDTGRLAAPAHDHHRCHQLVPGPGIPDLQRIRADLRQRLPAHAVHHPRAPAHCASG